MWSVEILVVKTATECCLNTIQADANKRGNKLENKNAVPFQANSFSWIIMKSTFIHIVLFFTLVPHLYYLAEIYNKIILYE